jgi:hypothetical protein
VRRTVLLTLAAFSTAVLALALPRVSRADVGPEVEAVLELKILSYDRELKERAGGAIVIGVLSRGGDKVRSEMVEAFTKLTQKTTIQGMTASVIAVDYGSDLAQRLSAAKVTVLYVAPSLESETAAISAAAAQLKLPTLSRTRSQTEAGLAVAVVPKEGKPSIVINLKAARASGMDLSTQLLRLAEVLQ